MRSSLIVCLLLGAVIKYAVTEQEYICGVGPHNYNIYSPAFTIYQLLERRVNLTIPLAGNQSESFRWGFYKGNSKLEFRTFQVLHHNGTIETHKSNASVLLQDSSYNGIQIDSTQVVNKTVTKHRGKRVTINTGDFPAVDQVNTTICDTSISVCVNITGIPPPSTTIQTQEHVSMAAKKQAQFCSTFDKPNVINILTVFITASNCFGSTTANASISFINDISRCNFTTCSALESFILDPQQPASTASYISCNFTSVTQNHFVSSRTVIDSTEYLTTSSSTSDKQTSTPTSIKQTSPTTSDKQTSPTRATQQKISQSTTYQQRLSLTTEYRKLATSPVATGTSPPTQKDSSAQGIPVYIIAAACVGALVLIVVILIIIVCCKRKSARKRTLNSDLPTTEHIYANRFNLSNVELQSIHDTANEVYESAKFEFPNARAAREKGVPADHDEHKKVYKTAMQNNTAYGTT
ncbi:mucin-5AC-like isoform X2 [Corticium candelabrum]|uniref:mucin-5AC-like isoform X2 n=1 Tax=Corticium candelabrum TaxID=121492 RepID=UPI002E263FEB|nr:mucin-5AC-like isoform X2 [Corticium candelabrum]